MDGWMSHQPDLQALLGYPFREERKLDGWIDGWWRDLMQFHVCESKEVVMKRNKKKGGFIGSLL